LRHLHCLHLAGRDRRKGKAQGKIAGDEQSERQEQKKQRAAHRQIEDSRGNRHDQYHLNITNRDVGNDLGDHYLDWPDWHRKQVLHRSAFALAGDRW